MAIKLIETNECTLIKLNIRKYVFVNEFIRFLFNSDSFIIHNYILRCLVPEKTILHNF